MSEPLLLRAAPGRSADLFHALPLDIIDPFLYIELDDRASPSTACSSATGSRLSGWASS
jgi:hypothetical protein